MGLTIDTTGLSFVLDDGTILGQPLTSAEFYGYLDKNVANIEVKGELNGGTVVWSEIELDL